MWGKEPELIDLEALTSWIHYEDDDLLVINKPGWVVCHPSKNGPLSSLVGACREYTGLERLHLVSRLDRETSGLVLLAKHRKLASICQQAIEKRRVDKVYFCLLEGGLTEEITVEEPLAKDRKSLVHIKQTVSYIRIAQKSKTHFKPLIVKKGYTLAKVVLYTGRKHQIRAHANWLGHPVVGDKLYGPDETLYLEFIEQGWTPRLEEHLGMKRQALHAGQLRFNEEGFQQAFAVPIPEDMLAFGREFMDLELRNLSSG